MQSRTCLLLVEDDSAFQETLADALNDWGFNVVIARNGSEALTELQDFADQFEGLITDIDLGTGPNGWEVSRSAREYVADIPIVYVSGTSGADWLTQGVADSVFIKKPCGMADLAATMKTLQKNWLTC